MSVSQLTEAHEKDTGLAVDRLIDLTANDMDQVNSLILSRADSHVEMVPQLARYLIEAGGKRLRPMLTLASAYVLGEANGNQIKYAAAIEFMHNATLLHDDVVDESDMRRGKPAARKIWGNQASVLVGDFLLGQAFMMMVEAGSLEALDVLSRAAAVIAEGEVLQLAKAGDQATSEADYMQIIGAKTAKLFEAATEVGVMAGGGSGESRAAMARYGYELGLAFQLVDDVLDYGLGVGLGKNVGDDLREGKMTLPVILALKDGSELERQTVLNALGQQEADDKVVGSVRNVLNRRGALDKTMERAQRHAELAQEALLGLPPSIHRDVLAEVAIFCVQRAY
ncbi:MAG: polyprenyl synthetase family protein [Hyphomicrobiaceae bacterium]|nr:polyprenyl synthetase family protein [Hyphomicrobiaceae bacterium]